MQKIYFKKMIDLDHRLKELVSISVDESINYKMENQGIRAYGSIIINGDYKDEKEKRDFHDTIDLDILAQFSKIEDKNDFTVKVDDFDYYLNSGNLSLVIQASVYGVKDDEDRIIETNMETHDDTIENISQDVSDEIEDLIREQDQLIDDIDATPEIIEMNTDKIIENMPKVQQTIVQKDEEDEDNEDIGTYYLYVVQSGDTYRSIAEHYQVDEQAIQNYNHGRSLSEGVIVIVPYLS